MCGEIEKKEQSELMQTRCCDCGKFVEKERRIPAKQWPDKRPLCAECASLYDDPAFM